MVHSETYKKALQFLIEHNYSFDNSKDTEGEVFLNDLNSNENQSKATMASKLRKRQSKCDLKIAVAIEKLRRSQYQMEFYENLSGSGSNDVQLHLTNTILSQNRYLSMMKEEPLSAKYGAKDYFTQPGAARLD